MGGGDGVTRISFSNLSKTDSLLGGGLGLMVSGKSSSVRGGVGIVKLQSKVSDCSRMD